MLVDSHCHLDCLDLTPYQGSLDQALQAAQKNGVSHFLCVCTALETFPKTLAIAEQYDTVFASVGLHPNEHIETESNVEQFITLGSHPKVVAVGETGLDYYRVKESSDIELQHRRFRTHVQAAKQLKKPLIIHTRQARADTLRILKEEQAEDIGGVMHCFTEDWQTAQAALDLNFYISFSGIITFKNAKEVQEVVKKVPLDRILVETDSPYLAPVPYRGKPNEPLYVKLVAEQVATLRGISFQEVAEKTTQNFFNLFHLEN